MNSNDLLKNILSDISSMSPEDVKQALDQGIEATTQMLLDFRDQVAEWEVRLADPTEISEGEYRRTMLSIQVAMAAVTIPRQIHDVQEELKRVQSQWDILSEKLAAAQSADTGLN